MSTFMRRRDFLLTSLGLVLPATIPLGCKRMLHQPTLAPAADAWQTRTPLPQGCGAAATVAMDGKLLLLGGDAWLPAAESEQAPTKVRLDTIQTYNPALDVWTIAHTLPLAASNLCAANHARQLWLMGGTTGAMLNHLLYRRDPSGHWESMGEWAQPAWGNASVQHGSSLYSFGGWTGAEESAPMSAALWAWDLEQSARGPRMLSELPGAPRVLSAIAGLGNRLYVFGGLGDPQAPHGEGRDAWTFDLGNGAWQALPPMPTAMHAQRAVTLDDDTILLLGGYGIAEDSAEPTFLAQNLAYHPSTHTWEMRPPLPRPICDMAFARVGELLIGAGGEMQPRHRVDWSWAMRYE